MGGSGLPHSGSRLPPAPLALGLWGMRTAEVAGEERSRQDRDRRGQRGSGAESRGPAREPRSLRVLRTSQALLLLFPLDVRVTDVDGAATRCGLLAHPGDLFPLPRSHPPVTPQQHGHGQGLWLSRAAGCRANHGSVAAHLDGCQRKGAGAASGGGPFLRRKSHTEGQWRRFPRAQRSTGRNAKRESLLGAALCRLWWLHWPSPRSGARAVELGRARGRVHGGHSGASRAEGSSGRVAAGPHPVPGGLLALQARSRGGPHKAPGRPGRDLKVDSEHRSRRGTRDTTVRTTRRQPCTAPGGPCGRRSHQPWGGRSPGL